MPRLPSDREFGQQAETGSCLNVGSTLSVRTEASEAEMMKGMTLSIQEQFGHIDIYVFDQILRGNIAPGMRVLDAGCGYGRNLVYLLREGC